ncbi:MAG: glycosyltransferase [Pseudomonadota bacterium]
MSKKIRGVKQKRMSSKSTFSDSRSATVSLCMIVKNEEAFLPRCLDSVGDVVDEIIVVDTGSSDSTVEIAKNYGVEVVHHEWKNDFSEARNVSIRKASSDWILVLDADEEVEIEDVPKIREVIRRQEIDGAYFTLQNKGEHNQLCSMHYLIKLFRNGKGIRYEGRIHELVAVRGRTIFSGLRINHFGYDLDADRMMEKYRRDVAILEEELERNPNDPVSRFYLARTRFNLKEYDDTIAYAESVLKFIGNSSQHMVLHLSTARLLVDAYLKSGELDLAETECQRTLKMYPNHIDFLFSLGHIFSTKERYGAAVITYQKYLNSRENMDRDPSRGFFFRSLSTFGKEATVRNELGGIYFKTGNIPGAITEAKKAVECDPGFTTAYLNLGAAYASIGCYSEATQSFNDALEIDPEFVEAKEYLERVRHERSRGVLGQEA